VELGTPFSLPHYARLLEVPSTLDLSENAFVLNPPGEPLQQALEALTFSNAYLSQPLISPFA